MATSVKLSNKTSQVWEKSRVWECLGSGDQEKLSWASSGTSNSQTVFLSQCEGGGRCVRLNEEGTEQVVGRIDIVDDPICALTSSANQFDYENPLVAFTAHKSGLIRKWLNSTLEEPSQGCVAFKADHRGPILHLRVLNNNGKNDQIITIGSDLLVKLWNAQTRHCSSVLRGATSVPLCAETSEYLIKDVCYVACGLVDGNVVLWRMDRSEDLCSWTVHSSSIVANTLIKHSSQVIMAGHFK